MPSRTSSARNHSHTRDLVVSGVIASHNCMFVAVLRKPTSPVHTFVAFDPSLPRINSFNCFGGAFHRSQNVAQATFRYLPCLSCRCWVKNKPIATAICRATRVLLDLIARVFIRKVILQCLLCVPHDRGALRRGAQKKKKIVSVPRHWPTQGTWAATMNVCHFIRTALQWLWM